MYSVLIAILLPFIIACTIPFIYKRFQRMHIGWFVLLVPLSLVIYFARYIPQVANGKVFQYVLPWVPSFDLEMSVYIDGLSLLFGLLITGIGALVVLYSIYYLTSEEALGHFYIYLLMFMGAMLGVVFTDHMLILYVFWEITSVASFLLIAFWFERKRSRYGALKSMLITVFGGLAMLAGFLMLYQITGTFSITENIEQVGLIKADTLLIPAMILILLGAFTKSAQFPFHIWLPDAMEAPTPVSAYLHSATMVKAGIYLVARFTPIFGGELTWFWLVSGIGLLTMFWGSFTAVRQRDLKALLAYSTISQLGLVMTLLGIGSLALASGMSGQAVFFSQAMFAGLFHLVNHSTFKGALFMVVGIIDLQVGTRDVVRLGGLLRYMPITFTIAAIGSFSMAGLPPFNGFLSKEMFFEAVLLVKNLDIFSLSTWGVIFPIVAVVGSIFTFVYCLIIVFQTFFGKFEESDFDEVPEEASKGMLIAPLILALFVVGIFIVPNIVGQFILTPAMASVFPQLGANFHSFEIAAWHGLNQPLILSLIVITLGILLYIAYFKWPRVDQGDQSPWTIDAAYRGILRVLEKSGKLVTALYMSGNTRDYLIYIYLFFVTLVGGGLLYFGAFEFTTAGDASVGPYELILTLVMMTAGIAIVFAKKRLTAVILNGVLGYSIALFFVIFRAPDLALTQLVIETVTTALFLLCFYFLPDIDGEKREKRSEVVKVAVAAAVGLVFILVGLSVNSGVSMDTIATYFENSEALTGGSNIVNAILGDFRAFDTMLEVIVLLIAGLGVYSLVKLRLRKGSKE